jgi:hypothetical protein
VWTTYGVVHFLAALPAVTVDERPVMALVKAVRAATGLGVTSLLWLVVRRVDPRRKRAWGALALLAIAAGFAWTIVDRVVLVTTAGVARLTIPWDRFPRGMDLDYFFVTFAWAAGALVLRLREREREAQVALLDQQIAAREAQVRELAGRLQPHFLFNSLNTIRAFAAEDPSRAREMLTRLSGFLRHALSIDPTIPVALAAELESTRAYLWIEEARFEPDLEVTIDVEPAADPVLVPPLILQPLVENALLHGEPGTDGIRRVRVEATRREGRLRLEVTNTGSLAGGPALEGHGLELTRSRLRQIYGTGARLELAERDGWVVARLEIDSPAGDDSERRFP